MYCYMLRLHTHQQHGSSNQNFESLTRIDLHLQRSKNRRELSTTEHGPDLNP
eukprot:c33690_g1_i1 orf=337-492(+)